MTGYSVRYSKRAIREIKKLDRFTRQMIYAWIGKNLVSSKNPRQLGKALKWGFSGQWRYRIGDYRIICHIDDDALLILALSVTHRKDAYR